MDRAALQLLGPRSQFHNPGFSCPHLFVYPEAWWRWGICSDRLLRNIRAKFSPVSLAAFHEKHGVKKMGTKR
jgi:hypothetical protein